MGAYSGIKIFHATIPLIVERRTILHVLFSEVQYSIVQCNVIQCSDVQCSAVYCSVVGFSEVQCSAETTEAAGGQEEEHKRLAPLVLEGADCTRHTAQGTLNTAH